MYDSYDDDEPRREPRRARSGGPAGQVADRDDDYDHFFDDRPRRRPPSDDGERRGGDRPRAARSGGARPGGGRRARRARQRKQRRQSVLQTVVRTIGELLFTAGLVLMLFAAYQVWGKGFEASAEQDRVNDQLAQSWEESDSAEPGEETAPDAHEVFGRLYVPGIGLDLPFREGVTQEDIRHMPGHYPESALPGQVGNFALAGHRTPGIFWELDQLSPGDPIVVETEQGWYTYEVTESHVVDPSDYWVVSPTATETPEGEEEPEATGEMLTLTTCHPLFSNAQRLIVHAELADATGKGAGRPSVLGEA
ncbi:class E sortase [Allonocardiopsis opalescens]|uniref:Sortase A n=1 Tax=Allonocardiopsis opalescens TaxID=1144618 RepID=A0A2T0Q925_9ACTN|nr:class E sortase [Allonocardiopsis opalescens]PRY00386.1 sortase A [Allonocardiopsis opalescens]